jgi:predicted transcriptional regulator
MTEEQAVTKPIAERPNSKLTADDARYVKENYPVLTMAQIANKLGVCKKTVLNIIHGKTFRDVR